MNPLHIAPLALLAALAAQAEVTIFDFGTKDSPLHPGAIRVTESGGERISLSTSFPGNLLRTHSTPILREWTEDKHGGKKTPPPVYHTDLTCDYIDGTCGDAIINLDLPQGDYTLTLLCGRAGGRAEQIRQICAYSDKGQAETIVAGPHELKTLTLSATSHTNGVILIVNGNHWLVNALIAVPAAEWDDAKKKVIDPLLAECFTLPPEEMAKWKETPRPSLTPEPKWTDQQKKDGLAVYTRPWAEPVWPDHFPRPHELDAPVRAFASPGEYEPLTFTLHPLKDFQQVIVTALGLQNTNGNRLPNFDVRFVRYMNVRPNYSSFNTYYRAPDVLMPWQNQPLKKGENLRVWLTVKVPPGQPPGLYTGEAEILVVDDGHRIRVPLSLRVLPITLQKDQSLVYGQYYHHPFRNLDNAPDDFSRRWWLRKGEAEHADMREHGMNTVVLGLGGSWKENRWVYAFDRLQRDIDLYRSAGFDKPVVCSFPCGSLYWKYMKADMGSHLGQIKMPPDAFFEELTGMVRAIENEARRRQWPELLYYPVDEPSTSPDSVAFMTRVMAAIKKVPHVRTYVTADPEHEQFAPMRPFIDVWCCQPFSLGREAVLADMKARGVEYWCYPNHISGENDHTTTLGARMTYGFGFWQSGYRALIPWIYQYDCGDPWNYLDSSAQDFFNRTADDSTPIPVTLWEAYREGIDDHRYVTTLENTIVRAEEAGLKDAAAQARATLNQIQASINVQTKYKNDGLWSAEAFDAWRWAVAEQIMALQKLLD